jgi:HD-like signal output (HDOD) protein
MPSETMAQALQNLQAVGAVAERAARTIEIPSCPAILLELNELVLEPEPDFDRVAQLVSSDVALSAAMLKTVNSPALGLRTSIASIQKALYLLGMRTVTRLMAGLLLRRAFAGTERPEFEPYWETFNGIAQVSALLSSSLGSVDRDEAYTFGLFRDAGMLAMMNSFTEYTDCAELEDATPERAFTDSEAELFGGNHARVGYELARDWRLPRESCLAILHHHDYTRLISGELPLVSQRFIAIALAAEFLFMRLRTGATCLQWTLGGFYALEVLGVDQDDLEDHLKLLPGVLGPL